MRKGIGACHVLKVSPLRCVWKESTLLPGIIIRGFESLMHCNLPEYMITSYKLHELCSTVDIGWSKNELIWDKPISIGRVVTNESL